MNSALNEWNSALNEWNSALNEWNSALIQTLVLRGSKRAAGLERGHDEGSQPQRDERKGRSGVEGRGA